MPIASSLLNKPKLVKKLRKFYEYVQKNDGKVGTKTRGIDLNFNNACNLRCKYCFTNSLILSSSSTINICALNFFINYFFYYTIKIQHLFGA